jgi:hypothetical protein
MTRRPPKGGVGEPLFGEEWWASDQRLFQDSLARKTAARRARRPATIRRRDAAAAGDSQLMLPWFEDPDGAGDESVRPDGAGALGAVAAGPVRGDPGSGQLLLWPRGEGAAADQPAGGGTGRGRPAGRGIPGEGRAEPWGLDLLYQEDSPPE